MCAFMMDSNSDRMQSYLAATPETPDPPAESAEAAAESEESRPALSSYDVADYFLGQPTEERLAEREQAVARQELQDGTPVRRIADEERVVREMVDTLRETCPGIDSEEFNTLAKPVVYRLLEEYGPEHAGDVVVMRQVYEELGRAERFGPDPERESWERAVSGPSVNAFTR
jgi:hypothetical protein